VGFKWLVHLTQGETQSLADGYSDIYRDLIDGIAAGVVATAGKWLLRVLQVAEAGALAVVTAVLNAEYDQIKATANKAMDKGQLMRITVYLSALPGYGLYAHGWLEKCCSGSW
jgi:hypothetical protein